MSVVRRRPPDFAGGMNGAVTTHSRSVKSDGYRKLSRLCSSRAIPVHPIGSSIFSTKTVESHDAGIAQQLLDRALRQAKRYDEDGGFAYRAKQCVTLFDANGVGVKHYFDIDHGGTPTKRQRSARQRREGIAHDVYRAVCDVERMNKNFPADPQLSFYLSFDDDVAEHRAAEQAARDKGSEAA